MNKIQPTFDQTFKKVSLVVWKKDFYNKNFQFLWNFVPFCLNRDWNLLLYMNFADAYLVGLANIPFYWKTRKMKLGFIPTQHFIVVLNVFMAIAVMQIIVTLGGHTWTCYQIRFDNNE